MEISKEQNFLIRALAIIMIILYHFQYDMFGGSFLIDRGQGIISWIRDSLLYIQQEPFAVIGFPMYFCFIGVNVFFVLSGYALSKKYEKNDKVAFGNIKRHMLKVLVPYWLAHPILHVADWILKNLLYLFGFIGYETGFLGMHSFSEYLQSIILFPRWFTNSGALIFDGTWWFVGIIIQFYLFFPLLHKLFKKYKPFRVLLFCLALTFLYRYAVTFMTNNSPIGINNANILFFINFPARLSEFALGIYLAGKSESIKSINNFFSGFLIIALGFVLLSFSYTMFLSDFLFGLGGIICLFSATKSLSGLAKSYFEFIGKKSYFIYLYHEPLMKIVLKFIFPNWISF